MSFPDELINHLRNNFTIDTDGTVREKQKNEGFAADCDTGSCPEKEIAYLKELINRNQERIEYLLLENQQHLELIGDLELEIKPVAVEDAIPVLNIIDKLTPKKVIDCASKAAALREHIKATHNHWMANTKVDW